MGRASGQRQLWHAHTHRPERYLGTFRTSYSHSYSYLSIGIDYSRSYSWTRALSGDFSYFILILLLIYCSSLMLKLTLFGDLLATLVLGCLCSIVFWYPCSEIFMNLNLPQRSVSWKFKPKISFQIQAHSRQPPSCWVYGQIVWNPFHKSDHLKKVFLLAGHHFNGHLIQHFDRILQSHWKSTNCLLWWKGHRVTECLQMRVLLFVSQDVNNN